MKGGTLLVDERWLEEQSRYESESVGFQKTVVESVAASVWMAMSLLRKETEEWGACQFAECQTADFFCELVCRAPLCRQCHIATPCV